MNQEKDDVLDCEIAAGVDVDHKTTVDVTASSVVMSSSSEIPNGDSNFPQVVFRTKATYSLFLWFVLGCIAVVFIIFGLLPILSNPSIQREDQNDGVIGLLVTAGFVVFLVLLVFPKSYEVRIDSSIAIITMLCTYRFPGVLRADKLKSWHDEMLHPRINLATNFSRRVAVRRESGLDVFVSPHDLEGFVAAINQVQPQVT